MHPLDRPAWASLAGPWHTGMSQGTALARRYADDVSPFAATVDDSPAALSALADLLAPGDSCFLVQAAEIRVPEGLVAAKRGRCVQMVCERALTASEPDLGLRALGNTDAPQMLALALLTEPGPFRERTHTMGRFVGVREGTELVAMAGERFRPPGYTEVSGVCTHPQWRGHGLARRLSTAVTLAIQARGDIPFLHAWTTNTAAIDLYRALGYDVRCEVDVAVLMRSA